MSIFYKMARIKGKKCKTHHGYIVKVKFPGQKRKHVQNESETSLEVEAKKGRVIQGKA